MISVIIPTHDRADLLPRAVESARAQTYSDLEIIVVSDGSTDGTDEVMRKIAEEDPRVKYIAYSPARGGNVARNTGIAAAAGEYLAFLDDDDEWFPEKLARQIAVLESDAEIGLVYTASHVIYANEKVEYDTKATLAGDLSEKILLDNVVGTTSSVLLSRAVIERAGNFDEALPALQDFDLWIRALQVTKVGAVSEPMLNYYNYRGKTQVSAVTKKYEDAFARIHEKYAERLSSLSEEKRAEKKQNEWFLLGNKAMRNGEPKAARRYFRRILKQGFSGKAFAYLILSHTSYRFVLKMRSKL